MKNKIELKPQKNICMCMCHKERFHMKHFRACCNHTYQKYLRDDWSIDHEKYDEIVKEYNKLKTK